MDLADVLGVAAPAGSELVEASIEFACEGLEDPPGCTVRELLLWLAGPYTADNGWLVRSDTSLAKCLISFEQEMNERWLVRISEAFRVLSGLGVKANDDEEVTELLSGWRVIGEGWLVRWRGSLADKSEVVLRLVCRPSTVDEVNEWIGEGHAASSVRNILGSDQRFVRLDKFNHYGLTEWDLEEYSGIAQEITERIERSGGAADLETVVADLVAQFGVSEKSVRMYANSPAFVVEHGIVRQRTKEDVYEIDGRIGRVRGLYVDPEQSVILHVDIDKDILRGSGRSMPEPAAAALGLHPGMRAEFTHPDSGSKVVVSWPVTATIGPSLGSVRPMADYLEVHSGDRMRLKFDPVGLTCVAEQIDPSTLSGLTGLDIRGGHEMEQLAVAMRSDELTVRAQLKARGDEDVLQLLPVIERSRELEDALTQFGNLLA